MMVMMKPSQISPVDVIVSLYIFYLFFFSSHICLYLIFHLSFLFSLFFSRLSNVSLMSFSLSLSLSLFFLFNTSSTRLSFLRRKTKPFTALHLFPLQTLRTPVHFYTRTFSLSLSLTPVDKKKHKQKNRKIHQKTKFTKKKIKKISFCKHV
jgi:hypothetical protein